MWKDADSLINETTGNKVYYFDSTFLKRYHETKSDTSFVNKNLKFIDGEIAEFKQFYSYQIGILDTIRNEQSHLFILIHEKNQGEAGVLSKASSIKLIVVFQNRVLSTYTLAEISEGNLWNEIRSSIILPGNQIITRTVTRGCSDFITRNDGRLSCWKFQTTEFYEYKYQSETFKATRTPIEKKEEEK
jgi:hypothetical protein